MSSIETDPLPDLPLAGKLTVSRKLSPVRVWALAPHSRVDRGIRLLADRGDIPRTICPGPYPDQGYRLARSGEREFHRQTGRRDAKRRLSPSGRWARSWAWPSDWRAAPPGGAPDRP